jgi:hypothetical protein
LTDNSWAPPLNWQLRTQTDQSLDQYREFWGDEFGWTALLPLAWTSYSAPGFSFKPVLAKSEGMADTYAAASYWSAAIHLLGLGMGWTDIGEGLRQWRQKDYPGGYHPILDFVKRNYGEDIRALEVWFGVGQRYRLQETLLEMARKPMGLMDEPEDFSKYTQWEIDYVDVPDEEKTLASRLLDGGDALHLEDHVVDSIQGDDGRGGEPWINRRNGENAKNVTFYSYGGWAFELARMSELRPLDNDVHVMDQAVKVEIEKIGYLGDFVLHPRSNRWFVFSHTYGVPSLQWEAHDWGNPADALRS